MESDYKVHAGQLPIFRALRGDVSDTIESVYPRLSKEFARYVASNFSSVSDIEWFVPEKDNPWIKWFARIQEPNRIKILERNYKLMKLNTFPVSLIKSRYNLDECLDILQEYRLSSYGMVWKK